MQRFWILSLLLCACQPALTLQPSPSTNRPSLPSAMPSPVPSPNSASRPPSIPTSSPRPDPSPTQLDETFYVRRASINGRVFDEQGLWINDATVRIKSLDSRMPYAAQDITQIEGLYVFNNTPVGILLEISASKPGYAFRSKQTVLYSTLYGGLRDPINFGVANPAQPDYKEVRIEALSNQPEITQATPAQAASGINPHEPIVLRFSEPMDRESVLNNFEIRAKGNIKLSIDQRPNSYTLNAPIGSLAGDSIWDKQAFDIRWNTDSTEATMTFKPGYSLPADKAFTPSYSLLFSRQDGQIKDQTGIARSEQHFNLNQQAFTSRLDFTVAADTTAPSLLGLQATTGSNGARLSLTFSEPMQLPTLALTLAGGLGGNQPAAPAALPGHVTAQQAAANYLVSQQRNGQMLHDRKPWSDLSGQAIPDPGHPDRILLTHGNLDLRTGDKISIDVTPSVVDPAGNPIEPNALQQTAWFGLLL